MEDTSIQGKSNGTMSVGEWMVALLISAIPIVNIVMFFVWGFGDNTNQSKANWAKASLIWVAIMIVLYILFFVLIFTGASVMEGIEV